MDISQEILKQLTLLNTKMDKRFEAIDRRFEAMDQRLEAMDRRLEAMDQRLEALELRMSTVERNQDSICTAVTEQIRIVGNTNAAVEELRAITARIDERLTRVESDVREMKGNQKAIFQMLGEHEIAIRNLNERDLYRTSLAK